MLGFPTKEGLAELRKRRNDAEACAMSLLTGAKAEHRSVLSASESEQFRELTSRMKSWGEQIAEYESELNRCGTLPEGLRNLTERGQVNSAGRISPLGCPQSELRRLFDAAQRGEQAVYEQRFTTAEPHLPPELFPYPIGQIHDSRILNYLPGIQISMPSIEFVRHTDTTGAAGSVAEGALKPEVELVVDKLVLPAVKLAAHLALSQEIYADWTAFSQYAITELQQQVIDVENAEILTGDGSGTDMLGFYNTPGILVHDAALDTGADEKVWAASRRALASSAAAVPWRRPTWPCSTPTTGVRSGG